MAKKDEFMSDAFLPYLGMSNATPIQPAWPFAVQRSLLTEDIRTRALSHVRERANIKEPLVETGYWVVAGDERQGYGLHLRDYRGTELPALPLAPSRIREIQVSFCHQLSDFTFLRQFTEVTRLWLIEVEKLPDWNFLEVMPKLEFFKFRNDVGVIDFTPLRHLRRLKELEVWRYDESCSLDFLDGCDSLETLDLAGHFTVSRPDFLIDSFPNLIFFGATSCTFDGDSVFEHLRQARPKVVVKDYSAT